MFDLFKKYDLKEAILIAPLEPFKCITKKEAVVVVEQSFEDLDIELVKQAWIESILKYSEFEKNQFKLNTQEIEKSHKQHQKRTNKSNDPQIMNFQPMQQMQIQQMQQTRIQPMQQSMNFQPMQQMRIQPMQQPMNFQMVQQTRS